MANVIIEDSEIPTSLSALRLVGCFELQRSVEDFSAEAHVSPAIPESAHS